MDDIRGMIDRLADLSEDELSELESSIIAAFEVVEGQEVSRESVAEMTFLADSVESVRAEMGRRDAEKAELAAEAAQAATRIQSADAEAAEAPAEEATEPPTTFATEEAAEAVAEEPVIASTEAVIEEAVEAATEVPVEAEAATDEVIEAAVEETVEASVEVTAEAEAAVEEAVEAAVEAEFSMDESEEDEVPEVIEEVIEIPAEEIAEAPEATEEDKEEETPVFANEDTTATSTEAQMSNETSEPTFSAPADRLPVARGNAAPIALVAGGDIPGISAGSPLKDRLALAEAMAMRLHGLRRASGGNGEQVVVASLLATFPEERTLRGNEVDTNTEKIKNVTDPSVIVASGGWCAPLPVNYDLFDIGGSTATPVKDSLPTFNADRGGIRFVPSPTFDEYLGAFGVWTNDDDIAAASDPDLKKNCLTVQCAPETDVYLEAVTMCMCFGNLMTRAFPELIARHNDLALVAAARFAEQYVLDKIKDLSDAHTVDATLGTARDVLIAVERAAVAYRYKHRLDPNLPLRFVGPQWLHAMIRSDLTAQLPGDGLETTFALADATIERFFAARNIRPTWSMEGASGGAEPTVDDYPDTVEWALFAEGTFTLLDGGTLDIGIVRDMNLVQKNDYCMFTEQFLAVAKTGLDSLWVTQTLNVNGASAGTLDVSAVDY
jgi:hypothetical protein